MHENSVPAEISRVLGPMNVVSVELLPPGMSGARVFRCHLDSGELRILKEWPRGTLAERVAEVDRVVVHSRSQGCELTPRIYPLGPNGEGPNGDTCLVVRDACWQMMEWMPGEPLAPDCDLSLVEQGAEAIARFHASVADLGTHVQPAGAITSRLRRARELTPLVARIMAMGPDAVLPVVDPQIAASLFQARQVVIWKWDEVAAEITRSLNLYVSEPLYTQFVLRDIHRENALFVDGRPSGLIDFDAVRIDTPWTDLARWTGGFLGGSHESSRVWEASMAGFCRQHALNQSPEMEFGCRLAKDLCFATNWIGLANWLVWLIMEQRSFGACARSDLGPNR